MDAEQLKSWRVAGREFLAADGAPASVNAEQRTVDVCFFTGADVQRVDWWTGDMYMLHFDPKGADLSLLNAGAPVLDHHATYDGAAGQMGKVERAWAAEGRYLGTLRFAPAIAGYLRAVDGLWTDIAAGIVTRFSMGVELLEVIEQRDQAGKLTMKTAAKWRPFEISTEPIPADFGTCTLSAAGTEYKSEVLRASAREGADMTTTTQEKLSADAIREMVGRFKLSAVVADKLIADGVTSDEARTVILNAAR